MAVSIRLRKEGAKNRPYYKVVVADSRSPRDGKFIEIIGTYDPKKAGHNSTLKLDRVDHWMSKGAQPSETVRSLIKKNKKRSAAEPETKADETASSGPTGAGARPEPTPIEEKPVAGAESSVPSAAEPSAE